MCGAILRQLHANLAAIPGINAALQAGGKVTGTVTDAAILLGGLAGTAARGAGRGLAARGGLAVAGQRHILNGRLAGCGLRLRLVGLGLSAG